MKPFVHNCLKLISLVLLVTILLEGAKAQNFDSKEKNIELVGPPTDPDELPTLHGNLESYYLLAWLRMQTGLKMVDEKHFHKALLLFFSSHELLVALKKSGEMEPAVLIARLKDCETKIREILELKESQQNKIWYPEPVNKWLSDSAARWIIKAKFAQIMDVKLLDVPVSQALKLISDQAAIPISYSVDGPASTNDHVTLSVNLSTAWEVLEQIKQQDPDLIFQADSHGVQITK